MKEKEKLTEPEVWVEFDRISIGVSKVASLGICVYGWQRVDLIMKVEYDTKTKELIFYWLM